MPERPEPFQCFHFFLSQADTPPPLLHLSSPHTHPYSLKQNPSWQSSAFKALLSFQSTLWFCTSLCCSLQFCLEHHQNSAHVSPALRNLPRLCPHKKCICQAHLFLGPLNTFCKFLAAFILFLVISNSSSLLPEPGATLYGQGRRLISEALS